MDGKIIENENKTVDNGRLAVPSWVLMVVRIIVAIIIYIFLSPFLIEKLKLDPFGALSLLAILLGYITMELVVQFAY